MRHAKTLVMGTLVSLGMVGIASAQAPQTEPPAQDQKTPPPSHDQKPEPSAQQQQQGQDLVGEKLEKAHESVTSNNMTEAATQMREAAKEIQTLATSSPKADRKHLKKAEKELDATAKKIEGGQTVEQKAAEITLAETARSLASFHQTEAERALKSKDHKGLASHLEQGGKDLGRAAKWTGIETERGVRDVVGGTIEVSGKITEGVGEIPKETGQVIKDLGRGIDRVGKDVTAKRKTNAKTAKEG